MRLLLLLTILLLSGYFSFGQDSLYLTNRTNFTDFYGRDDMVSVTSLTPDKFVIAYREGGEWEGRFRIGSIKKDSIVTLGRPITFSLDESVYLVEINRLTNTKFVLTYSSSHTTELRVCEVFSDNFVLIGKPTTLFGNRESIQLFTQAIISENTIITAYFDPITDIGKCVVGKINDKNEIFLGTPRSFTTSSINTSTYLSIDTLSSTKFVIAHGYHTGTALVGSIDAKGEISLGTSYQFSPREAFSVNVVGLNENQFALVYSEDYWQPAGTVRLGSIKGQEVTYSDRYIFYLEATSEIAATKLSPTEVIIGYNTVGMEDNWKGYVIIASIYGNSVGFSRKTISDDLLLLNKNKPMAALNEKKFIVLYDDKTSSAGYLKLSSTERYQSVTAIPEERRQNYSIFPNPVKDFLQIKLDNEVKKATIKLYDLAGRIFLDKEVKSTTSINLSNYQKGTYLLQINDGRKIHMDKIIVK